MGRRFDLAREYRFTLPDEATIEQKILTYVQLGCRVPGETAGGPERVQAGGAQHVGLGWVEALVATAAPLFNPPSCARLVEDYELHDLTVRSGYRGEWRQSGEL